LILKNPLKIPVIMAFGGNDPSGGAGICADIETIISLGCHPAPVITVLTVQDTRDVHDLLLVDSKQVLAQAKAILEDIEVSVFKIGVIGSVETAIVLHHLFSCYPNIPIVLDPVFSAGGGAELANTTLIEAIKDMLLPLTTILTPNSMELRRLAPEGDTFSACAMSILESGCEYVLITGGHEPTDNITNSLYGNNRLLDTFQWPRLTNHYHGSGCTLASAIAALLAQGYDIHSASPTSAVFQAQNYVWRALEAGYQVGSGQMLPNRLFWATLTKH
jgi:hydroxymethylpyrimidine/phosphomethylpyrimidine kinase